MTYVNFIRGKRLKSVNLERPHLSRRQMDFTKGSQLRPFASVTRQCNTSLQRFFTKAQSARKGQQPMDEHVLPEFRRIFNGNQFLIPTIPNLKTSRCPHRSPSLRFSNTYSFKLRIDLFRQLPGQCTMNLAAGSPGALSVLPKVLPGATKTPKSQGDSLVS